MTADGRTLPDHAACATHERYFLSCADYEELLTESAGGCQICRFPASRMPQRKLYIDHDYRGYWAVRGLLCINCNSGLGNYRHPTPDSAEEYLASAWFTRRLAEGGLGERIGPEPPTGAVIRDFRGTRWVNFGWHWSPLASRKRARTWRQMYAGCGPLYLRVIAVRTDPFTADPAELIGKGA